MAQEIEVVRELEAKLYKGLDGDNFSLIAAEWDLLKISNSFLSLCLYPELGLFHCAKLFTCEK